MMKNKLLLLIPIFGIIALTPFVIFENSYIDASTQFIAPSAIQEKSIAKSSGIVDEVAIADNVEFILKDSHGNIKQIATNHNKVVTHGENCVAKMIFGQSGGDEAGTSVCVGAINSGFNVIQLGESATAVSDGDINLVDPADEAGLSGPQQGSITWTNSTNGSFSTVVISKVFTNTGSSETINEAGIFNSTTSSTNGMYARVTAPSPFVVANGDTLTVNWTFETGSAAVP